MQLKSNGKIHFDEDILLGVNHSWSTDHYVGIEGWVLGKNHPVERLELSIGGVSRVIETFSPHPGLRDLCEQHGQSIDCGFQAIFARSAAHEVRIVADTAGGRLEKTARIGGAEPSTLVKFNDAGGLFEEFQKRVNADGLSVLEIGSRVVSPGSKSKRPLFHGASEYVGFDYYGDSNTDIVGDAHRLASFLDGKTFDAVFSLSVLEHIAMPWVVAVEINKVLKTGGITFHQMPLAVPIHERPWDFWRCTEEALKVLFAPPIGFDVLKTGYSTPVRVYPDAVGPGPHARLPLHPTFGGVAVLAAKTSDVDADRFRWDMDVHEALGAESHYPKPLEKEIADSAG